MQGEFHTETLHVPDSAADDPADGARRQNEEFGSAQITPVAAPAAILFEVRRTREQAFAPANE